MQRIQEIMTRNPKTCELSHPITCTLEIMRDENVGVVPVVDSDQKLKGIITDRDIALSLLENMRTPDQITVQECINNQRLITIKPDEDVQQALYLMEKHQVRRLPVVDEQFRCIGIVAQADLALKVQDKEEVVELVKEVSKERQSIGSNP